MLIMGIKEREVYLKDIYNIFKIIAENFPKLKKEIPGQE
jgi:hypothetical protein